MKLTRLEMETGIIWNDAEDTATIWTTSPVSRRRFTKQFGPGKALGSYCTEWTVKRRQLTVRKKSDRPRRAPTEAQLAVLRGKVKVSK